MFQDHDLKLARQPHQIGECIFVSKPIQCRPVPLALDLLIHLKTVEGLTPVSRAQALRLLFTVSLFSTSIWISCRGLSLRLGRPMGELPCANDKGVTPG